MSNIKVYGKKSGGHTPKEDPNTLQAGTIAQIVDLLCEGPIEGPAVNDDWEQSIYYNETQLKDDDDNYNFQGVTIKGVTGEPYASQDPIPGFDKIQNEISVNTVVTNSGGAISRTVTDTETDDIRITIRLNGLMKTEDDGDLKGTYVSLRATVTPDGGFESDTVLQMKIKGKTTSTYSKQFTISNISQYGAGPWTIKVYRNTDDSDSSKLVNGTTWWSYTIVKNVRLAYPDSVIVGHELDAKYFGNAVPKRAFKIKGLQIKYPSNYNPTTRNYSGVWDGTFSTGYCNNPAWVVYDLLLNERYGCGDTISADMVDKYALYTIGQYCDCINELGNYVGVTVTTKYRGENGVYTSQTTSEPRFTFNGVIATREQALAAIVHLCSVFRGFPIWSTGYVSFVQDAPKEISRIATPSNVKEGFFEYSGTPRQARHTAIRVTYNDPDNFSQPAVVTVEDEDGILEYGYNAMDITAIGCNSRNEAIRRGKYILYGDINQTESVTFQGGIEWADALPGEVIGVQDPNYSLKNYSGRITSATATSITADRTITFEAGVTYTLYVQISHDTDSDDDVDETILTRELNNSPGTTNVFTWATIASYVPLSDAVWVINASNLSADVREFTIMNIKESNSIEYTINAIEYNSTKYAEIEDGLVVEGPPPLDIADGKLTPPSNIAIQPYTYAEGDSKNRKYGLLISWVGSDDPRTEWYDIEYREGDDPYELLKSTSELSFDWRNITAGTFDFRVKGRTITLHSAYAYYNDFTVSATVGGPLPPTNLRTNEGSDAFSGRDCHILWDPSDGSSYTPDDNTGVIIIDSTSIGDSNVVGYKVEVYTVADLLLRTYTTSSKYDREFIYTYEMNSEDNSGSPIRQIKFKVYTMDVYGDTSDPATLVAENPAPDMSSTTPVVTPKPSYLKIEWTPNSDLDMDYYNVYCDTSNPPTTLVGKVIHPDNIYEVHGLEYGTTYYCQIEPYDGFGIGIKSVIPGGQSPLIIPSVNIGAELSNSIEISTDTTASGDLQDLYDGDFSSGGITIDDPSGHYINYHYGLSNYFDRVAIWSANANPTVYFAVSDDAGANWEYFAGYSGGELTSYGSSQANAITNAWSLSAGFNYALLPDNVLGRDFRVYFTNSNATTIYEFIPARILIAELAAIDSLSSISANIGTIIAGNLQTSDYGTATGMNIDLDAKRIYLGGSSNPVLSYNNDTKVLTARGTFQFTTGSTGYANISDKPAWAADANSTWIDGGKIYVGSTITLRDGGKAIFGNSNVIIDTAGNHGSIVVAPDGGPTSNSYCHIDQGDIKFYYWNGSTHLPYNSMTRIELGTAAANSTITIPGVWKETPKIMVAPHILPSYDKTYPNQSQTMKCYASNITKSGYTYTFKANAQLELAAGSVGGTGGGSKTTAATSGSFDTATVALAANTRTITVGASCIGYKWEAGTAVYTGGTSESDPYFSHYQSKYRHAKYSIQFWYRLANGTWYNLTAQTAPTTTAAGYNQVHTFTFTVPWQSSNITHYLIRTTITGYDSVVTSIVNTGNTQLSAGATFTTTDTGYASNLAGTSVLLTGSLNWMAIGR